MVRFKRITAASLIATIFALAMLAVVSVPTGDALAQSAAGGPPAAQVPQPADGGVNWSGAGWGAAALVSNVVYIPAKFIYAALGGLVGGASWALTGGNSQTANTIWRSSLGGDYVVTPDMLQGKQSLHFSGPTATAPQPGGIRPINPTSASAAGSSSGSGGLGVSGSPSASPAFTSATSSPSTPASSGAGAPYAASQPIDHGSGPVGGTPPSAVAPLPSSSIE